jgi:hypothetical protein
MKKTILAVIFILAGFGLYAANHPVYTIEYPDSFTLIFSSIIGTNCAADNTCTWLISVAFSYKNSFNTEYYRSSVKMIKIPGITPDSDPIINFKVNSYASDFQLIPGTTTQMF